MVSCKGSSTTTGGAAPFAETGIVRNAAEEASATQHSENLVKSSRRKASRSGGCCMFTSFLRLALLRIHGLQDSLRRAAFWVELERLRNALARAGPIMLSNG